MKVQVKDLLIARPVIERLFKEKMPVQSALKIARIVRELNKEFETIQQNAKPEATKEEIDELLNTEIELSIQTIRAEDLASVAISPEELLSINWLMEE